MGERTAAAAVAVAAIITILLCPLVESFGSVPIPYQRVCSTSFSFAREEVDVTSVFSTSECEGAAEPAAAAAAEREQRHLRFSGVGRLYHRSQEQDSEDAHLAIVDKLALATCAVIGVGGVGSWAAEALCRSGVGNIVLVDMDEVCISNVNRQLHATASSIGKSKIHEMERRLRDINSSVNVTTLFEFVTLENMDEVMDMLPPDTICLDCIDGQREKAALIVACYERQMPVVTCGGAAGRKDPTKIVCSDLTAAQEDRLLFSCRKLLRKHYGWPKGPGQGQKNNHRFRPWNIKAVFSTEIQKSVPNMQGESSLRRCDGALGTACFVTGTYGFVAASRVIEMIADDERLIPVKPSR